MNTLALTSRRNLLRLSVLAAAVSGLSGCQSVMGTTASSAELRVIDASSDPTLPGLDFYLGKTVIAYNLGSGTTTSYVPVTSGSYTASAVVDGTNQTLASAGIGITTNKHYSVVAGNTAANLQLTVLTDQASPAPTNEIDVRFLDESMNVGAVDVYFVPSGGKLTTTKPAITNLTFGVNSGYLALPAGTYQISIVPTGTVPIATTVTLYSGATVTYGQGTATTFVLMDTLNVTTPAVNLITVPDYPAP